MSGGGMELPVAASVTQVLEVVVQEQSDRLAAHLGIWTAAQFVLWMVLGVIT